MNKIADKFIRTGLNSFIVYQTLGWTIYFFAELILNFSLGKLTIRGFFMVTFVTILGFVITLLMRLHYRKIDFRNISLLNILLKSILISLAAGLIHYEVVPLLYWVTGGNINYYLYYGVYYTARGISYYSPIYFGWSILYFSIKFWLEWENQKKIAEKASALVQNTQFQMLRYHLNPHFLFNALNSIRALIDEDTVNSRKLITELSEYLRYSLVSRNKPSVSIKEELEAINHYLSVEKQRYEEKLSVLFDIDPKTKESQIPSFIIQPLIENAIKFGMKTSKMPLEIIIKTKLNISDINISVINSGNWVETQSEDKELIECGIENIRARMKNFFNDRFSIDTFEKNNYVYVILKIILREETRYGQI